MNISLRWLSDLLGTTLDAHDVAERLAMLGAPVESIEPLHEALAPVIVGVVEHAEPHPDADRLTFCRVNDGTEVLDVVCGAPNVQVGGKYPYARVGTVLPGGLKLTARKIRGIRSNGMLCSARELELGADQDGILELQTEAPAGTPLLEVLEIGDHRLDVEVTPNRPDLLCHRGVARDLGAALGRPVKLTPIPNAPTDGAAPVRVDNNGKVGDVEIRIEDHDGCHRFIAALITGVEVGPSPEWLQQRLIAVGQRPINNVVDATNYIMLELNHPMHAYDRAKLAGPALVARRPKAGEKIVTLDDQERPLPDDAIVIGDAQVAAGIGGTMGGRDSEVSEDTTDVVLECAYFSPKRIRAARTALRMSTDASYRFERGTDIDAMPDSVRRAVSLIRAVAGGEEAAPPTDVYPKPRKMPAVFLRPERVAHVLGVDVPKDEIERLLSSLGFSVGPKDDRLAVHVPGWRPDVTREEDLIEEIARLKGYDSFPVEMRPFRPSTVPTDPRVMAEARARRVMTSLGLHEARSSSLGPPAEGAPEVLNPLSAEEGYLRADLLSGLRRAAEHNWSVRERDVRLFEIGTVFTARGGSLPGETRRLAGVISGSRHPAHWSEGGNSVAFDHWDVKSLLREAIRVAWGEAVIEASADGWRARDADGAEVGWAGALAADAPPWAAPLYGFEVAFAVRGEERTQYAPLPTTPAAERDLALVLPGEVTAEAVDGVLRKIGGTLLESARVFDEYRGDDRVGRSVAWRLTFRAPNRTLRDRDVDAVISKLLKKLEDELGVTRRET